MPELVFLKQGREAVRFPLKMGRVTLGRRPDCEITLEGSEVSREHAVLWYEGGYYHLEDRSKNGIKINNQPVKKTILRHQDLITIGDWQLQFRNKPAAPEKETATVTSAQPTAAARTPREELAGMVGASPKMRELFELIQRIAPSPATVLILGETGTGKELVANALHQLSKRAMLPFVPVNCAAISPTLVESELFGHERGAFTGASDRRLGAFEQAAGGTLFLDEVGELSPDLQGKLLRAIEAQKIRRIGGDGEIAVKCRLVAATNRDLVKEVKAGQFREDLYYRLFVMPMTLPPLRQRREDIPLLVDFFLREMRPEQSKISKEAMRKLKEHLWPGNVRELKNVILRAVLLAEEEEIDETRIVFLPHSVDEQSQEPQTIAEMEKELILQKLKKTNWNKAAAARELGVATSTVFKKIKAYGLKQDY